MPDSNLSFSFSSNTSRADIEIIGYEGVFQLQSFRISDDRLSTDYIATIEASSRGIVDITGIPGRRAILGIQGWGGSRRLVHGYIAAVRQLNSGVNEYDHIIEMRAPLARLALSSHNRVFLASTVRDVVSEVLVSDGFHQRDFRFELNCDYPVHEYLVQYEESDREFIDRLLSRHGIHYYYTDKDDGWQVVFSDDSRKSSFHDSLSSLMFSRHTAQARLYTGIYALNRQTRLQTTSVCVSDYNYRTPSTRLKAKKGKASGIPADGEVYLHGANFKDNAQGEQLATCLQELFDWQRDIFTAETDSPHVRPGYRLRVDGHPDSSYNTDYFVISVTHRLDQKAGNDFRDARDMRHYRNEIVMIRASLRYRPPMPVSRRQIPGVMTAVIEGTGGEYAYLDEQGRYRIRLPYDESGRGKGRASHPVRLATSYTGKDYGLHCPLHNGAEVLVSCVNGDIDRPVIMGALYNPQTPSPVDASNRTQNILRTWGGNELVMDDKRDAERVSLFTRARQNQLDMSAEKDRHKILLETAKGRMDVKAARTMLFESGKSMTCEIGKDHEVVVENEQRLMTRNKDIGVHAATDIACKAGRDVMLLAEKQDIVQHSGKDYIVEVGQAMSMDVRKRDMKVIVDKGNIDIKAAKNISIRGQGGGSIVLDQSGGRIEISSNGNINIAAPAVTITAGSIRLKGQAISSN